MYRQGYSDQQMPSGMNSQMGGYDFRSPSIHYKPPNTMESINPNFHQPHQLYYENQPVSGPPPSSLQQNPYMNMMPVQNLDPNYDMQRYYWRQMEVKHQQSYPMPPPAHSAPQYVPPPNVVQRIAGIIKSQLPGLQAIMVQVSSIYNTSRVQNRRQYSRSRSRSKQRHRKSSDSSHDWLCRKCSFSNYDWRDNCKKCGQIRPMRNFVPGPEDWKCPKCGNINYARRMECNRCKRPKLGND